MIWLLATRLDAPQNTEAARAKENLQKVYFEFAIRGRHGRPTFRAENRMKNRSAAITLSARLEGNAFPVANGGTISAHICENFKKICEIIKRRVDRWKYA